MKRFTSFLFATLIVALAGSNLSAAVTHTLLGMEERSSIDYSASEPMSRTQSPVILAGESTTVTKTKTKTKTKTVDENGNLSKTKTKTKTTTTTTTSSSDDSDSDSANSGDTDYHGVSYEGY
ncbi:MAG: hypothetical protein P8171_15105 [Candidatus Thiodiazotropha sp.]